MSSTASEIDIANMALGWIGADTITSFDDDSTRANLVKLNYERSRDVVLESEEWSFALDRRNLTPDAILPAFRWGQRFKVPTDILRIISVDREDTVSVGELTSGTVTPAQIPWELQGGYILCNFDTIWVLGIRRVTSTGEFTEGFVHALAARLAADLAIPIQQSRALQMQMMGLYEAKIEDASATDGLQGRNKRIRSRYLLARR